MTRQRCGHQWSTEDGLPATDEKATTRYHVCDRPPGHDGDHRCSTVACGATESQDGAA